MMPNGSMISVKMASRWIGLQGPQSRISWIQKALMATTSISATHV